MRLHAFQGLRYTDRAGDPGLLAAPPYDQIDDAARDRFHAASPHQFVHLTRPSPAPSSGAPPTPGSDGDRPDPYRHAAELHRRWLRDGIVARDERPALYPYVIRLALEATHADLEPALLLAEDEGRLEALLAADLADGRPGRTPPPLVDYRDPDGHHHLLFRIADPARIAAYQQAVAGHPAAIADGHHRYKVGQRFAVAHHVPEGTAAGAKLAVVTSVTSRGLTIDPIHRALRQAIDPARLAGMRTAAAPFAGAGGADLARAVAAAPQPALGVWVAGRPPEVWRLAPGGGPGRGNAPLVVEIFQEAVLPALGLSQDAANDGTLIYRSNPDDLYAQVARGELGTGFWLPPMQPAEFAAAIAEGHLLPPKSTRFLPKAMSGLVWSDHESEVI